MLREIDLAWAAGFIDGEGSFMIIKQKPRYPLFNYYYQAALEVNNTVYPALEHLVDIFGIGNVTLKTNYNGGSENTKYLYAWRLVGFKAGQVAELILPFLVIKKRQAELVVSFVTTLSPTRSTRSLTDAVLSYRESLREELQTLNRRGRDDD